MALEVQTFRDPDKLFLISSLQTTEITSVFGYADYFSARRRSSNRCFTSGHSLSRMLK
jgi:hypothetical protein